MSEKAIVRNFTIKDEQGVEVASNVQVSAPAENVYFTIGAQEGDKEYSLKEMVFGDSIPSSDALDLYGKIKALEDRKVEITAVPNSAINDKILIDKNDTAVADDAVLTYNNFKTMHNLESQGSKVTSALSRAYGEDTTAGIKGFKILNYNIYIDNPNDGIGYIQLDDGTGSAYNILQDAFLSDNTIENRYISILLDYCYINCSKFYFKQEWNAIAVYDLPQHYLENRNNEGNYNMKKTDTEWVNGTVFFTYKNNNNDNSFHVSDSGITDVGLRATAFGYHNIVLGENSFASGHGNIVYGANSFAMGVDNQVDYCSYADGRGCIARGKYAHAEGRSTIAGTAKTDVAHAEGNGTQALGESSHAEGQTTIVKAAYAHGEGARNTIAEEAIAAHAEGWGNMAYGERSHAEGWYTYAFGLDAHAEGKGTENIDFTSLNTEEKIIQYHTKNGVDSIAVALGEASHIEGQLNFAQKTASHAEGKGTQALETYAHSEGRKTVAYSYASHAEGVSCTAKGQGGHAEGYNSHIKGTGYGAHVEGYGCETYDQAGHAEGYQCKSYGLASHAEGYKTIAGADGITGQSGYAHAEGQETLAGGYASHVGGQYSTITRYAEGSFAHGRGLQVQQGQQFVIGKFNDYNRTRSGATLLFAIGNGTEEVNSEGVPVLVNGKPNVTSRSNVFEVWSDGAIFVNGTQVHWE